MPLSAIAILKGLGGPHNVLEVEPCVTRLRIEVVDSNRIDQTALRRGCHGVIVQGNAIQLVVGPNADVLASELQEIFPGAGSEG